MFFQSLVQPCRKPYILHKFDVRYLPPATAEGAWALVDLSKPLCQNACSCTCKPRLIPVFVPCKIPQTPLAPTQIIAQMGMDADMANDYLYAIGLYNAYLAHQAASVHDACANMGFSAAAPPMNPQQFFKQLYPDAPFCLFAFLEPAPAPGQYSPISPPTLLFVPSLCQLATTAA